MQNSQNTRTISISNDASKSHGYHIRTAKLRRTSSWRSICLYPSQNGRCSTSIENSQIGMSRHLDSSTTTQMAEDMVQYRRANRSSWAESVRSSLGRTFVGKAIWENLIKARLGESFQMRMSFRTPSKRVILICVCGWHHKGWKEKYKSHEEKAKQRSWFGRTNIIPRSCVFWL